MIDRAYCMLWGWGALLASSFVSTVLFWGPKSGRVTQMTTSGSSVGVCRRCLRVAREESLRLGWIVVKRDNWVFVLKGRLGRTGLSVGNFAAIDFDTLS